MAILTILLVSCYAQKNLSGSEAFSLKQFSLAKEKLKNEFDKEKDVQQKSFLAYTAGRNEIALHNPNAAIPWFEKAYELYEREEILFALAKAYKAKESYSSANKAFRLLYEKFKKDEYKNQSNAISAILSQGLNMPDPQFTIEKVSAESGYSEYSPAYFDNKFIVFSSDRNTDSELLYPGNGKPFSDLFLYSLNEKSILPFSNRINTEKHEGTACFNKDYSQMFFTRCENFRLQDEHCRIYTSSRDLGRWTEPQAIGFFPEEVNVGHPALIAKDSILIFSAAPHGNFDSYELYYSRRYPTGWSKAEQLPTFINTAGNEKFPTVFMDTLYYSSDLYMGFGGLDIYKTYLDEQGQWVKPVRLPMPINSGYDDFGLVFNESIVPTGNLLEEGFYTSSRDDGIDRIYSFDKRKVEKKDIPPADELETSEDTIALEIFLAGLIYDEETNEKLDRVSVSLRTNNKPKKKTSKNGQVIFDGTVSERYSFNLQKEGYFSKDIEVNTFDLDIPEGETSYTVNFSVKLNPIKLNEEVVIDNIYYDYDKWDIREDAQPALEILIAIINNNPQIKLQLASHTDCRGPEDYNYQLSSKRASSVMNYLIQQGISPSRLSSKGYGEDLPLNNCNCDDCTEEEHQTNRRTTFKVLSY